MFCRAAAPSEQELLVVLEPDELERLGRQPVRVGERVDERGDRRPEGEHDIQEQARQEQAIGNDPRGAPPEQLVHGWPSIIGLSASAPGWWRTGSRRRWGRWRKPIGWRQTSLEVGLGRVGGLLGGLEGPERREERCVREGELAGALRRDPVALPADPEVREARGDRLAELRVERRTGLGRDRPDGRHECLVVRRFGELGEVGEGRVLVRGVGGDRPALVVLAEDVLVVVGVVAAREGDEVPFEGWLRGLDRRGKPGEAGEGGDLAGREASGRTVAGDAGGAGLDHVLGEDAELLPHRDVGGVVDLTEPVQRPST